MEECGAEAEDLLAWFAEVERDLPWRGPSRDPWLVLVSEIMLQQTQVDRVVPYFDEWRRRWPAPADLAAAPGADVLRAWGGLGYPRRAMRLQQAAAVLRDEHDNVVPDSYEELIALPGVGPYTASAVLAFAHRRRIAVLDTNVRRAQARVLAGLAEPPTAAQTPTEHRAATLRLPQDQEAAATASEAWMELGALVCRARTPDCDSCPLTRHCAWFELGRPQPTERVGAGQPRFEGSDRQVRGLIMAALRASPKPVRMSELDLIWHEPAQRDRALASLLADGLATQHADGIGLPGQI